MTILYLSDFDLKGSGYANIAIPLCTQLAQRGYDVQALGLSYNGEEHHFPFHLAPINDIRQFVPALLEMRRQGMNIEAVIVALDIPLQEAMLNQLNAPMEIPYIGLFPIEAPPLCQSWAMSLLRMNERLIMSEFGVEACEAAGVPATFIPIGVDCAMWRPPTPDERAQLRKGLGIAENSFVVLTVADNQERKNLSRSMEIFSGAFKGKQAQYFMVTRANSPVGWKLQDYALQLGIHGQLSIWDRGISQKQLWSLYAVSDCFLLTSKAEGLAMPVLEAMAMRVPVVGTRCTAIEEHLYGGRGFVIEPENVTVDAWGNSYRYFAGLLDGLNEIDYLYEMTSAGLEPILNDAQAYTQARTWGKAADVLIKAIERVKPPKRISDPSLLLSAPILEPSL